MIPTLLDCKWARKCICFALLYFVREWINNIHRDTYASLVAHSGVQLYMSAAEGGTSLARIRYNLIQVSEC